MTPRPYSPADASVLGRWIDSERVNALWCAQRVPYPFEADAFAALLRESKQRSPDSHPLIFEADNGQPRGFALLNFDRAAHSAWFSFVLVDCAARGQGYGTALIRAACAYAWASGCTRASLLVFEPNCSARRCYQKAGFRVIGTEEPFFFHGERWNRLRMQLCAREET